MERRWKGDGKEMERGWKGDGKGMERGVLDTCKGFHSWRVPPLNQSLSNDTLFMLSVIQLEHHQDD